jgi:hypothetical protein
MLSVVKGIEPKDQVEAMLAAQMAAVHTATMTFARRCFTRNATMSILPAKVVTDFISSQRSSFTSRNRVQRSRSLVRHTVISDERRRTLDTPIIGIDLALTVGGERAISRLNHLAVVAERLPKNCDREGW